MKTFAIIFNSCLALYGYGQAIHPIGSLSQETGLLLKDAVTRMLIHHSSGDRAYDHVKQISMWDRSAEEKSYNEAARWVMNKAEEFGLDDVETENYPTPEETDWVVKKGELWAVSPYSFKITSYDDLPMSLAFNSSSIDTTAELV